MLAAAAFGLGSLVVRTGDLDPPSLTTNDFTPDYVSARAVLDGRDPYAPVNQLIVETLGPGTPYYRANRGEQINAHPPAHLVLIAPLARLPFRAARALWFFAGAAMIVAATFTAARAAGWGAAAAGAGAVAVLGLPVVQMDLALGQSNALIALMVVMAWRALRTGRDVRAGVLLGLAAAVRLFPVFLLIPLLRRRNVRALAAAAIAGVVTTLASVTIVGIDATLRFARALPADAEYWRAAPANASLPGAVHRWLTPSAWRPGAADAETAATVLALLASLALVVLAFRTRSRASGDALWATVPIMLLAAPIAWQHYAVLVVPLLVVTVSRGLPPLPSMAGLALVLGAAPKSLPIEPGAVTTAAWVAFALPTVGLGLLIVGEMRGRAEDQAADAVARDAGRGSTGLDRAR